MAETKREWRGEHVRVDRDFSEGEIFITADGDSDTSLRLSLAEAKEAVILIQAAIINYRGEI